MKNGVCFISPLGKIYIIAEKNQLCALVFETEWESYQKTNPRLVMSPTPLLKRACAQLKEYFLGKRKQFDLRLELVGTGFQKKSWQQLLKIPYGTTISYKEQAAAIGKAKATRAVGSANGKNKLPIIIPCHRVISSTGKLGGYSGGLKIKKLLLELEKN